MTGMAGFGPRKSCESRRDETMAKGSEKGKKGKSNKPKLSVKEKKERKAKKKNR